MKKILLTLATLWIMATPNAKAKEINTTVDAKKNLVEVLSKKQVQSGKEQKTISFGDAKSQQEIFDNAMKNEKMKELIKQYWQKEVEKVMKEIMTNEDTLSIIEELLKDEKAQKAIEEWNEEELRKIIETTTNYHYKWNLYLMCLALSIIVNLYLRPRILNKEDK